MRDAIAIGLLGIACFAVGRLGVDSSELVVDLPAAIAVRPHVYPDGSLSPDYKDAAIATLQVALDQALIDYKVLEEHDAMIHSGACVPWGEK